MKITDIELIPIYPRLAARYDSLNVRTHGLEYRIVVKITTDNGIVGYGDHRSRPNMVPDDSIFEPLIGRNPFDFLNNNFEASLGAALYDVMGKYLEIPAYKLMGQKVRDGVTVAAWCRPSPPEDFREEIGRAVSEGYRIFKMHTDSKYDPIEQTLAAEGVAPEGFKIHYDFNGGGRTVAGLLPLVTEMERDHPIVGVIEDPLPANDISGWRELRSRTRIPLIYSRKVLGGLQEAIYGVADVFMIGDFRHDQAGIGETLAVGAAYSKLNIQTIMQLTGGTLTKALALHMNAVIPTATGHSINLDDQYAEDITTERIPVIEGYSPVPERPGLGYDVDEDALRRLAAQNPRETPRHVAILHLPGGEKVYSIRQPSVQRMTGREEGAIRGIRMEVWEDDGTPEFEQTYERTRNESE